MDSGSSPATTSLKFHRYLRDFIHSCSLFGSGSGKTPGVFQDRLESGMGGRSGVVQARQADRRPQNSRPCGFAARSCSALPPCLAISAASLGIAYLGFERISAGVMSYRQQRRGSRSGAQYRPRADLVSVAGALLCGDRQGRRRQGGAGRRGQPEGRHHAIDEGHHQSGADRADRASWSGNSASSQKSSPTSSRSSATARC